VVICEGRTGKDWRRSCDLNYIYIIVLQDTTQGNLDLLEVEGSPRPDFWEVSEFWLVPLHEKIPGMACSNEPKDK